MKVALLIAALLILCFNLPGSVQARFDTPKSCVGPNGKQYLRGEHYEACIRYTCVSKENTLEMEGNTVSCDKTEPSLASKVTALESNVQALEDSVQYLQTTMESMMDMMITVQSTANEHGRCLADISSSGCPPPARGKTSVAGGISGNTAALADKCDASICSAMLTKTAQLECINDVKIEKDCMCSRHICESNHICVNGTRCAPECINDVKIEKDCMCSGDVCESNHICVNGITCTSECIKDVKIERECMCTENLCGSNHICVNGATCTPGSFTGDKCFEEDTNLSFHNIGKNQYGQITLPDWQITQGGRALIQLANTRPSLGVSDIRDPSQPVSYKGRIFSDNSDSDVIGIVFGYQDKKNFFVVASSSTNSPGPHNWYVGRVHATCGTSCHRTKTISKAIWNPTAHPTDITVLKTGTDFWLSGNKYKFSICFNPSKLLMDVTIVNESSGNATVLETGIMAAVTGEKTVDDMSRGGGSIGVYVDSQQGTTWERLECGTCSL